jgi:hypothetical protein
MKERFSSNPQNDEDKRIYVEEHFCYEVEMLLYAFMQLGGGTSMRMETNNLILATTLVTTLSVVEYNKKQSIDQNFSNMAQETFLLHARNLREFFYRDDKQRLDDARAFEFFIDKDSWRKLRPNETDSIKEVKNRADKELAHLTYKRISGTPPEKLWDYRKIFFDFIEVIEVFLKQLPEKYFGQNSRNLAHKMEQLKERFE